jgi:tRNA G26 N,N-dimethylase Trm1
MEADGRCWSYEKKYLGRFVRYGTPYHHDTEMIFEYGTVYGNVTCLEVPKKYSWDEIKEAAKVNAKTIAYFTPIYAGVLYSRGDYLEIIEEMRDEQRHKQQLDINQQGMDDLDDSFKPIIQQIIRKT